MQDCGRTLRRGSLSRENATGEPLPREERSVPTGQPALPQKRETMLPIEATGGVDTRPRAVRPGATLYVGDGNRGKHVGLRVLSSVRPYETT